MASLKAQVRGGHVVSDERVDLPEGTSLEIELLEPVEELDAAELARLDAALAAGEKARKAGAPTYSAQEVMERLRARR